MKRQHEQAVRDHEVALGRLVHENKRLQLQVGREDFPAWLV